MNSIIRTFGVIALLGLGHNALAQTVFTVTATASATTNNYVSGSSYTFVFTLGSGSTFSGAYTSDRTSFQDNTTADDQLWTSVGGTGLSGTYVRPVGNADEPWSIAAAELPPHYTARGLYLVAGSSEHDSMYPSIGVTTLAGAAIYYIEVSIDDAALPSWTMAPSGTAPSTYFAGYAGTYTGFAGGLDTVTIRDTSDNLAGSFDVTSVAISAVPEPSTYAAMLGLAALGFAGWRRRKLSA